MFTLVHYLVGVLTFFCMLIFLKERSTLKVRFSHCINAYVKIKTVFNGRPIRKQDFEIWIDFYALILLGKLMFKIDYSLEKANLFFKRKSILVVYLSYAIFFFDRVRIWILFFANIWGPTCSCLKICWFIVNWKFKFEWIYVKCDLIC